MKTFTTIFAAAILGGTICAQQIDAPVRATPIKQQRVDAVTAKKLSDKIQAHRKQHAMTAAGVNERISPTSAILNGVNSGGIGYYIDPLFVDSTVTTNFGSGATSVQTLKAGGVFDPSSTYYYPSETLPSWEAYTIDTIWVAGSYTIVAAGSAVKDTLQLEVSWGPVASAWYTGLSIPTPAEKWAMPLNTVSTLAGNKSFSTAPVANSIKLKHAFVKNDTVTIGTTGKNWPYIPMIPVTPIAIPAGSIVGIEYTYINKLAHTANQNYHTFPTNNATMNSYMAYEAADTSATSHHWFYDSTSYGTSGALYPKNRYGIMPTAQAFLNGVMFPMTDAGYLWDISLTHSVLVTGADNLSKYGVALYQNTPNPFNGTSEVHYQLGNASDVVFTVYDITGRVVIETQLGKMDAGMHTVSMNAAEFTKGVYFYNIKANGASFSKKMTITE